MLTKFGLSISAAILAISASAASAETIVFDPLAAGVDVITGSGSSNSLGIDINQDGYDDVRAGIGIFFGTGGFIQAINNDFRFVDGPPPGVMQGMDGSFIAPFQTVAISATGTTPNLFSAGDEVGADTFGDDARFADLFGSSGTNDVNILPDVGDSGFLGFRIDLGMSSYVPIDGFLPNGFIGTPDSIFGFLFLEHGSIRIGQAGFNNASGQAALIPGAGPSPVPLPAALPLMGAGFAALGFLGWRRKRKAA